MMGKGNMENSIVLNNGLSVPVIGGGTFPYKQELETIIPHMVEIGFRLFDTSDNYDNEQHLGKALSKIDHTELESLTIVTKYSNPLIGVKEAFELSAKKIFEETSMPERKPDIYLMHWPYPYLWEKRWREMEELYRGGTARQ